jgi:uncharacterized membrane protein
LTRRDRLRVLLAFGFIAAGLLHLISPQLYRPIMPAYLPAHDLLIAISGFAEIAGGIGLLVPGLRRFAGWGLLLLLLAVFPANVEMLRLYRSRGVVWWGEALLWLRLPFQFVLAWWVLRAAQGVARRTEAPVHGD